MKGPVPIPIFPEVRKKYEEQIIAAHASGDKRKAQDLAKSIEQEFVDAANAQGIPGQVATPYERIDVDLAAARKALGAAKGESDNMVIRTLIQAAERASGRINESV